MTRLEEDIGGGGGGEDGGGHMRHLRDYMCSISVVSSYYSMHTNRMTAVDEFCQTTLRQVTNLPTHPIFGRGRAPKPRTSEDDHLDVTVSFTGITSTSGLSADCHVAVVYKYSCSTYRDNQTSLV